MIIALTRAVAAGILLFVALAVALLLRIIWVDYVRPFAPWVDHRGSLIQELSPDPDPLSTNSQAR